MAYTLQGGFILDMGVHYIAGLRMVCSPVPFIYFSLSYAFKQFSYCVGVTDINDDLKILWHLHKNV